MGEKKKRKCRRSKPEHPGLGAFWDLYTASPQRSVVAGVACTVPNAHVKGSREMKGKPNFKMSYDCYQSKKEKKKEINKWDEQTWKLRKLPEEK